MQLLLSFFTQSFALCLARVESVLYGAGNFFDGPGEAASRAHMQGYVPHGGDWRMQAVRYKWGRSGGQGCRCRQRRLATAVPLHSGVHRPLWSPFWSIFQSARARRRSKEGHSARIRNAPAGSWAINLQSLLLIVAAYLIWEVPTLAYLRRAQVLIPSTKFPQSLLLSLMSHVFLHPPLSNISTRLSDQDISPNSRNHVWTSYRLHRLGGPYPRRLLPWVRWTYEAMRAI